MGAAHRHRHTRESGAEGARAEHLPAAKTVADEHERAADRLRGRSAARAGARPRLGARGGARDPGLDSQRARDESVVASICRCGRSTRREPEPPSCGLSPFLFGPRSPSPAPLREPASRAPSSAARRRTRGLASGCRPATPPHHEVDLGDGAGSMNIKKEGAAMPLADQLQGSLTPDLPRRLRQGLRRPPEALTRECQFPELGAPVLGGSRVSVSRRGRPPRGCHGVQRALHCAQGLMSQSGLDGALRLNMLSRQSQLSVEMHESAHALSLASELEHAWSGLPP